MAISFQEHCKFVYRVTNLVTRVTNRVKQFKIIHHLYNVFCVFLRVYLNFGTNPSYLHGFDGVHGLKTQNSIYTQNRRCSVRPSSQTCWARLRVNQHFCISSFGLTKPRFPLLFDYSFRRSMHAVLFAVFFLAASCVQLSFALRFHLVLPPFPTRLLYSIIHIFKGCLLSIFSYVLSSRSITLV